MKKSEQWQRESDGLTMVKPTPLDFIEGMHHASDPFLARSDLADQLEPVRVVPADSSMEELSKIWSVFCQTTYVLSLAYKATVILIEGEEVGEPSLLIRERKTSVVPL